MTCSADSNLTHHSFLKTRRNPIIILKFMNSRPIVWRMVSHVDTTRADVRGMYYCQKITIGINERSYLFAFDAPRTGEKREKETQYKNVTSAIILKHLRRLRNAKPCVLQSDRWHFFGSLQRCVNRKCNAPGRSIKMKYRRNLLYAYSIKNPPILHKYSSSLTLYCTIIFQGTYVCFFSFF